MIWSRYSGKLPQQLKTAVTSRVWALDADDMPARKCKTWEDIADAVDMELETRVDTRCIGNRAGDLYAVNEGAGDGADVSPVCKHCGAVRHTALCATRAAFIRNEVESSERKHARFGTTCYCGKTDHLESHHLRAAGDSLER